MLTSKKVINAINEQIGSEFSAELQYYAIAAHFAAEALPQFSQHFFPTLLASASSIRRKRLMIRQNPFAPNPLQFQLDLLAPV